MRAREDVEKKDGTRERRRERVMRETGRQIEARTLTERER